VTFLSDILSRKRAEVDARRAQLPEHDLAAAIAGAPAPLGFLDALAHRGAATQIIAEVKRASPSAGAIRATMDAPAQAQRYERAGAAAISVLTDGPGFGGSLADLAAVRAAVGVPLLRKDFIIDRYQLLEARRHGADAVLLIVAALGGDELERLLAGAAELGLAALVEVHDEGELEQAIRHGARVVGINNRNLHTFRVDLATSERLLPLIPAGVKGVAESGIRTAADAARLRAAGAANLLIGEALVRAADPEALLQSFRAA
jgi:indole-3-glycerol phosphate synthase